METAGILAAVAAGVLVGLAYFGGLWLTIRRLGLTRRPAWWLSASFLLRAGGCLAAFWLVAAGDWARLAACLAASCWRGSSSCTAGARGPQGRGSPGGSKMRVTDITPDQVIVWQWGAVVLNATILYTWVVILVLAGGAWLLTRRVSAGPGLGRWQNLLEVLVGGIRSQLREIGGREAERYLPFIGSLFLFIAAANFLSLVPGYHAPTGSLSTTAALALCVFVAVPLHGIARQGLRGYLAQYVRPNPFMLPFNVIGELSRTLALAVRLFGNVMSTGKIVAILLAIAPLFFPVVMQALELLTGLIQAYIFAVLATVYIASASRVEPGAGRPQPRGKQHG